MNLVSWHDVAGAFLYYPKEGIEELERNNATACIKSRRRLHNGVEDDDEIETDPLCFGSTPTGGRRRSLMASESHVDDEHRRLHIPSDPKTRMTQVGNSIFPGMECSALTVCLLCPPS